MARGYFRTGNDQCVLCGANGDSVNIYARGVRNAPTYCCERCFDAFASELEKKEKWTLIERMGGHPCKGIVRHSVVRRRKAHHSSASEEV